MIFSTLLIGALAVGYYFMLKQPQLSPVVLNHPASFVENLLSAEEAAGLRDVALNQVKQFENIAKDLNFYKTKHEHIGEAMDRLEDGSCSHPLFIPSHNGTSCVLPGRFDVAQHFVKTGGFAALKENFDTTTSRLQSFADYIFDVNKYPIIKKLFASKKFLDHAKSVCPDNKQYLDSFQMNFILQVPGQTVSIHTDAPYFWGATRFQFPQWLLVAMTHSGLFRDRFVDQVQVVAYFHEWNATKSRGGEFVFWDTDASQPKIMSPQPQAGTMVDGSKVVHTASVYHGPTGKASPPYIDKGKYCVLKHVGNDAWQLRCDDTVVQKYTTDDLRFAIVYRARCFADAAESERFNNLPEDEKLDLESILETFRKELVTRGRLNASDKPSKLDLALLIVSEFIKYPHSPTSYFPVNYCSLAKLYPKTKPILDLVC